MATRDSSGVMRPIATVANASLRLVNALDPAKAPCNSASQADDMGALKVESHVYVDIYRGTLEQLQAVSLVNPHELPGQPGLPKWQAAYLPDGTLRVGKRGASITDIPEARFVRRLSARNYEVWLMVPEWEKGRRIEERAKERDAADSGRTLANAREHIDAQRRCIAKIESEMALPHCEIIAQHRRTLQGRLEVHKEWLGEAIATVEELSDSRPEHVGPSLTLAYSAARGTR
jgi:hypothetical protein